MSKTKNIQYYVTLFIDAVKGKEEDYTAISIKRAIVLLSIPMILELFLESVFAVVDIYFVAKVSTEAIATVALTESVVTLLYAIAIGVSMAATAIIARRIGEKKNREAAKNAVQVIGLAVIVSIFVSIIGIVFAKDILRLMGGAEEVVQEGYRYTQILLGGNVTIMLLFLINAIFRGAGEASKAMRALWLANGLNIILDPIFIFALDFGVTGAAIATTTGRGIAVIYQLYLLFKGSDRIKILKEDLAIQWDMIRNIVNVSIGGVGQFLIATMSWVFLMRIMSEFGTDVLAGYAIAIRAIMFTIYPAWGMSNAAATLVGQNLGADQPERAEKSVWITAKYVTVVMIAVSVIYLLFAKNIASIFTKDLEVLKWATSSMILFALGFIAFSYGMVISQAFNGAGDTKTPTKINFIAFWLIEIPLAYFLALKAGFGPNGVIYAVIVAELILAVIAIYLFKKGNWKTKIV